MQTSIFIARLLGVTMLVVGIGMFLHQAHYRSVVREFVGGQASFYLVSVIGILAGLAIVLVHNVWVADWRVLITLVGWANLIRGVLSVLAPQRVQEFARNLVAHRNMPIAAGSFASILGVIFCYFGYFYSLKGLPP